MLSHVSGTRQEGSMEQRVQCAVGAKQGENKSRDNQQESSPETFQDVQILNRGAVFPGGKPKRVLSRLSNLCPDASASVLK